MEEDIKVLKDLKNKWELNAFGDMVNVLNLNEIQAIENLIKENEELKQAIEINDRLYTDKCNENKELRERNKELEEENKTLREYIFVAPNLDEMTAIKYQSIQRDSYIKGRAEEQQRAREIIHNHYIPKQKVIDKIEELKKEQQELNKGKVFVCFTKDAEEDTRLTYQIEVLQELLEER